MVDRVDHNGGRNTAVSDSRVSGFVRNKGTVWVAFALLWLALGVFSAGTILVELPPIRRTAPAPAGGSPSIATRNVLWQLAAWLAWILLAPVALRLKRRWPVERVILFRSLPVHGVAVLLLCIGHSVVILLTRQLVMPVGPLDSQQAVAMLLYWSVRDLPFAALFYGLILGIGSAADYYQRFRERQLRASQLETQLAHAELQMLKMQLHPHFLFNTLNGITALVRDKENSAAIEMLVGLSDLLRQTLDNAGKHEVRLAEELEWLELYLKLQQIRFSDRLRVSVTAEPETLDALVPNLITQPLVENAIRHGLASSAEQGSVSLLAQRIDDRLVLKVCDDGTGLPKGWNLSDSKGLGLLNTEARLRQLYRDDFVLAVQNRKQGGVEASITIPLNKTQNQINPFLQRRDDGRQPE